MTYGLKLVECRDSMYCKMALIKEDRFSRTSLLLKFNPKNYEKTILLSFLFVTPVY